MNACVPGTLPTHRFIGEPGDYYDSKRRQVGWNFGHAVNDICDLKEKTG